MKILDYNYIAEKPDQYLSFPDILKSRKQLNKLFLVYRSGNNHHPTYSILHFLVSEDAGKTWEEIHKFNLSLLKDGKVWNCPRLSYLPDGSLNIFCDTKTSTDERTCYFEILNLVSVDNGSSFLKRNTGINGMLPDHIISFKNNLYCANHLIDRVYGVLTQFVNRSIDGGKTWHERAIIGRKEAIHHCEASLINYRDKYLIAYIRNNAGRINPILKYMSSDGVQWKRCKDLPVYGHRPTTILLKGNSLLSNDKILISFRNTKDCTISLMCAFINSRGNEKDISCFDIDHFTEENLYHGGYTGLEQINKNTFIMVYYIRDNNAGPRIKSCHFTI